VSDILRFECPGIPQPQGSATADTLRRETAEESDVSLALRYLRAVILDRSPHTMRYFVSSGDPVAKSRVRWSRKSRTAYTPQQSVTAQEVLAWQFKALMGQELLAGPVAIVAVFYRPNYQRIDADNLMKLVMDAATQAQVWKDDSQVTAQASFLEFDPDNPRTLVAWCETTSSMDRTRRFVCKVCGVEFERKSLATLKHPPQTCSPTCRGKLHIKDRERVRCAKCDFEFVRNRAGQRYCSPLCGARGRLVRQRASLQRPWPQCEVCGQRVSRREYLRCSGCSRKGRRRKTQAAS